MDALIAKIYAAAATRVPWSDPLDAIASEFSLWGAQIVGVDKRNGSVVFSAGTTATPPEVELDYVRYYHSINPRIRPSLALQSHEWMHCHEHFDERFVAQDPFYQEYLIPYGGRYLSGTKLQDDQGFVYLLGLMRPVGARPLDRGEMGRLDSLKYHLTEAFSNFAVLQHAYAAADTAHVLFARFGRPMLLLEENRRIVFANTAAQRLLSSGRGLVDRSGLLACVSPVASSELTEAIRALALVKDRGVRRVVSFQDVTGEQINLFVSAIRPEDSMQMFGSRLRIVVMAHSPNQSAQSPDPTLVAECFSLTPAEARVAVKLAAGCTAKEIAIANSTSIATVRTQVQSLMAKVGVDRQVELVRKLLALP